MARQQCRSLHTFIAVVFTAYGVFSASHDAETQRFNTAWTLINSNYTSAPSPNVGQVDGGGRKEALAYLRDNHQSLQGADLSQAILSYFSLDGVDLNRTTMMYTDLYDSDLRAASLWSGIITDAQLQFSKLLGADLNHADLRCADLRGAHLEQLPRDDYIKDILSKWSITELIWKWSRGHKTNQAMIEERVRNEWVTRQEQPNVPTNLTGANLSFAHLEGADLRGAILVNATLNNTHLDRYNDKVSKTDGAREKEGHF